MPHIVIEATEPLARRLDFPALLQTIHRQLADSGSARLHDLKSRVHITNTFLAGDDAQAQFIVARLVLTNPRSAELQHSMALVIHNVLRDAIAADAPPGWWQCCVLVETLERALYQKTDSRAPG
ncbi:hypothetical protein K6V72_07700 [Ralstonia insidiosa]|jgi:5-carboxymethyl-2-hydroxymuconate isomerase|uniref:5-carboxymethyl-2-hydroxymuconate isomerase family protein n=1 Tax=Ralstonia insidiosa TaxID=190721 RepID=A0A191ZSB3_9RALS|nr:MULTISPECIES: hypothetical protein [Ralstonia]ANH72530.1 5-carboxymethyl-2-hydroxymuconate isomerase family protein [Ralstonia insidiosa]ANJ71010.1 hypothetical protein A9Y76_00250 [Ralstonia insidiosa]EPX95201.1 hypothetical protein C404_22730 [Ralstonia sp. AU12-08]KAB0471586.1 hypothetical protein F7R11_03035 [Ralstonia insidiosa]MBY4708491.1 hypothetical protein [Ralstonia insidiosa]